MSDIIYKQGKKMEWPGKNFDLAMNQKTEDFWKISFLKEGIMFEHRSSTKDLHLIIADYMTIAFSLNGKRFRSIFRLGFKQKISTELDDFTSFCVGICNGERVGILLSNQLDNEIQKGNVEALDFFQLYLSSDEGDLFVSYNPQVGGKYAREFVVLHTDDRKVCRLLKHLSRCDIL